LKNVPTAPVSVAGAVKARGGAAAAWLTVTVCPATERVPDRAAPVFSATEKVTVPVPVPLTPDVTVMNDAFDKAVHAQPEFAFTVTVDEPAVAPTSTLPGTEIEQLGATGDAVEDVEDLTHAGKASAAIIIAIRNRPRDTAPPVDLRHIMESLGLSRRNMPNAIVRCCLQRYSRG
jgi:hypothetical protein